MGMRQDLERLKKIRAHRGLRHCWCLQEEGRLIFNRNPLFPREEMSMYAKKCCACSRALRKETFVIFRLFLGANIFLAFLLIFYVNSFYIEFVPSRSFSASHRKKLVSLALSSPLDFLFP